MQNSSSIASHEIPQPIARALRRLIQRVRGVILLRGVSAVVATAVGCILLVMAIDATIMLFSQAARWALTLSALAATVAVAVWFLAMPLARTITLTGIARSMETRHPELHERLSSAVELLSSKDIPEIRGSEALINALAAEATLDARHVQPQAEVPLRSARPFLLAAGGTVLILAGLLVLYPGITARLFKRAVAPFMNLPNISADMLRVTPGDTTLAEGQRLQVQVEVANLAVRGASFRKLLPDGSERAENMTSLPPTENGNPRFTLTCPPAAEGFRYRIHAGDALSRYYTVTVVPPPAVKRIDARYEFPAYTRREPVTETNIPGDIRAVAGTKVNVSAIANKELSSAELLINGRSDPSVPIRTTTGDDGTTTVEFELQLKPRLRGRWALKLTDKDDFTRSSGERLIEALPDKPPTAAIITPDTKKLRLKPSDRLAVVYEMTDDFGLGEAEFLVETDARQRANVKVPLPPPDDPTNKTAAGQTPLELSKLPLVGAKQFTFRLRAVDNLPGDLKGPQQGLSQVITVELDLSAASYTEQVLRAEEEAIRKALEKILAELKETKKDSVPLKDTVANVPQLDQGLSDRVARMRDHLGKAKATSAELTPRIAEGTFAGLTPKAEQLGSEIGSAEDQTGQVKLVDTPQGRGAAATQADRHADRAITLAEELLKQLEEMADAVQLAQTLTDMADREADLAAQMAAMEAAADQAAAEWQQEQAALAGEVGELVSQTPSALQAQLARDQQLAQDLAAQARELQQEQQALAQNTGQLGELGKVNEALAALAAEQAALAQEAAGAPVAADQAPAMGQAARNIEAAQLAQAVAQQRAAEAALTERAEGQPAGGEPAGQQPAGGEPAGQQPAGGEPAGQQPAGGEPAGQQPAGGEPAGQQPAGGEPAGQQPAGGEPAGQQPAGGEPAGQQPAGGEPAGQQPAGGEPAGQGVTPEQAQQAGQLAAKQQDIRQRTEALLAQQQQAMAQMAESRLAQLQAEQAQVAREATELAESVAPVGAQPALMGEQAAHNAQAAAQQLPSNIGAAAQSASSAAEQLGNLAEGLGDMAAQRASGQPAGGEPAGGEPSGGEPSGGEPSGGEPSGGEPSGGEPSGGEPSGGEPSGGEPSGGEPSGGQPSGGQPSAGQMGQMAQEASGLAARQQALAAEMQAMAQQNPQAAMAAAQAGLQAQTGTLQEAVSALGQRVQATAPDAAGTAGEASQAMGSAMAAEGQAQEALSSASPQSAVPSQASAAESLGAAAQALSNLGQGLAQAASGMPSPSPGEAAMGEPMAEGYSAASEAAGSPSAASAAEAAGALAQAAGQAMGMAQGMGAHPGMGMGMRPGMMPSQSLNSRMGIGPISLSLTASKLKGMGIKLSDWARLPGELRNQILQAAEEGGPEEYRVLIKRYFQKVAKRGSASSEEGK